MFTICFPKREMVGKHKKLKTMITSCIVFDHRGRTKKGAEGPLEIRVTSDRRSYYINTGVRVRARQWTDRIINHPQAETLNEQLDILLRKVGKEVNAALNANRDVDVAEIRKKIYSAASEDEVLPWMRSEIERLGVVDGTRKHYVSLVKRLEEFELIRDWSDVTVDNIYKLDAWLRNMNGRSGKITGGAVYNYHKSLRSLLGRAERSELIPVNPYNRLRGVFSKGDRENTEYLTEDEMELIRKFSPAPSSFMERARDLFVFQMYTGLSYSDAQAFDISAYKKIKGKWCAIGSRIKTGVPYVNQLLPPAVEVLERYGMTVPKMTNQVYNRELKHVGQAAGITYPLHSHLARHTFATYMLAHGVKIENLAKMLGHANIKQTQRYAKVLAQSVHEEFDKIEKILKKKKK